MGLTDYTRYSDDPVADAMKGIDNIRLKTLVRNKVFGSVYDRQAKPTSLGNCRRYLILIGQEDWDCNCPAKSDYCRRHDETCSVTPEYAALVRQSMLISPGATPNKMITSIAFTFWNLIWDSWDENKRAIRGMTNE